MVDKKKRRGKKTKATAAGRGIKTGKNYAKIGKEVTLPKYKPRKRVSSAAKKANKRIKNKKRR